jgi:hypothetical protein
MLPKLLIERSGNSRKWHSAGSIQNAFRLSESQCVAPNTSDSLHLLPVAGIPLSDSTHLPGKAVGVRVAGWMTQSFRYFRAPGELPLSPEGLIGPIEMTVEVAFCDPDSVTTDAALSWIPLRVRWREKPATAERAQEIHGWMAGMAALQIIYREFGLLPDDHDLVFESKGRNR